MGTLTSPVRSGCWNPCVGVGTILLGPGPGDICVDARTWGAPRRDRSTSPGLSGLETGDNGGRLCLSPPSSQGQ